MRGSGLDEAALDMKGNGLIEWVVVLLIWTILILASLYGVRK